MTIRRITWSQIRPLITPWRWLLVGAVVSVTAGAGLALLPPLILGRLIDNQLAAGQVQGILALALAYLGATVAGHVTAFLTAYSTSVAAQGALKRLRVQLFEHLQKLPIAYYDHTPIGDIISRCTADMETIDHLFSSGVISLLAESLRLVVTFVAMLVLSWRLSLALIVTLPFLALITRRFQILMRNAQRTLREEVGSLNAHLQESLTRTEVIKAFNWEFRIVQRFRRVLARTLEAQNRSIAYGAVYDPLLKILQALLVACFLTLSASPVLTTGRISVGTLTAFILLFDQFFGPLIQIGNEWQVVQGALAGLERIFQVLTILPERTDGAPPSTRTEDTTLVVAKEITFGYRDGYAVLSHVSLQADGGQHIALVGRTGAGKSSLFGLLAGLYRPWAGTIRLQGLDPNRLEPGERRRILGAVPQAGWMFAGTVAENLTLRDPSISREAVEKALQISGASSFVRELPDGHDTVISDAGRGIGTQLSVGQKQLLALARALVGDPIVLLLDEATAAVDGATEAAFRQALARHLHDRQGAVITIAHRLSTAMEADHIIVMEAGRIVEAGSPEDLLGKEGPFAGLWQLENAGWEWRSLS